MKKISDEEKSAAATLSDMEIFIFPELMYALVLANILSPRLWRWRELDWFAGIREMRPKKRLQRLRQHIMDNYTFNLDLDTWGLTTQQRELARFAPFLSPDEIAKSNALFGYHGDAYYYDIDIRRHFGLDKYGSDTIPYWKTETIEAMDAFRHKPGHSVGAGECVSLAGLYAAAAFVVCGLPLDGIYLMATPLHSQNFIDADSGILTNNGATASNPSVLVNMICTTWMGRIGALLAVLGVVAAPITSGDTAYRSARLIVADFLHLDQKKIRNRLLLALPLFVISAALVFVDFDILWRYFAWTNQTLATCFLWTAAVWLCRQGRNAWIAFLPAVFMTVVVTSYLLGAPEGFRLPYTPSLIAGIVLALALGAWFLSFMRKSKKTIGS